MVNVKLHKTPSYKRTMNIYTLGQRGVKNRLFHNVLPECFEQKLIMQGGTTLQKENWI
jgi:hypothetical protein